MAHVVELALELAAAEVARGGVFKVRAHVGLILVGHLEVV
jgi:hypothetical protein